MKVDGTRQIETVRTTRVRAPSGFGGAFAPEMPAETRATSAATGAAPLAGVDALIALQEVPSATTGRAKAARRGRDMLDLLDDVREGLLDGGVRRSTLQRLLQLVSVNREEFLDPGLAATLDDIELRARVELAKLNFVDAA